MQGIQSRQNAVPIHVDPQVYFGSETTVPGVVASGDLASFAAPITVSVDLTEVTTGTDATLYFDLLGFGALGSSVTIDDVRFVGVGLNNPPSANVGGPYAIDEGGSLPLDASGSSDPDDDPLTFSWDVNGDGVFGDTSGEKPTLDWIALQN